VTLEQGPGGFSGDPRASGGCRPSSRETVLDSGLAADNCRPYCIVPLDNICPVLQFIIISITRRSQRPRALRTEKIPATPFSDGDAGPDLPLF
jgi:hypothetical protein